MFKNAKRLILIGFGFGASVMLMSWTGGLTSDLPSQEELAEIRALKSAAIEAGLLSPQNEGDEPLGNHTQESAQGSDTDGKLVSAKEDEQFAAVIEGPFGLLSAEMPFGASHPSSWSEGEQIGGAIAALLMLIGLVWVGFKGPRLASGVAGWLNDRRKAGLMLTALSDKWTDSLAAKFQNFKPGDAGIRIRDRENLAFLAVREELEDRVAVAKQSKAVGARKCYVHDRFEVVKGEIGLTEECLRRLEKVERRFKAGARTLLLPKRRARAEKVREAVAVAMINGESKLHKLKSEHLARWEELKNPQLRESQAEEAEQQSDSAKKSTDKAKSTKSSSQSKKTA